MGKGKYYRQQCTPRVYLQIRSLWPAGGGMGVGVGDILRGDMLYQCESILTEHR